MTYLSSPRHGLDGAASSQCGPVAKVNISQIATLTADELLGWEMGRKAIGREYQDGEKAALVLRARQLRIDLYGKIQKRRRR